MGGVLTEQSFGGFLSLVFRAPQTGLLAAFLNNLLEFGQALQNTVFPAMIILLQQIGSFALVGHQKPAYLGVYTYINYL